jgi:hypothetical protein
VDGWWGNATDRQVWHRPVAREGWFSSGGGDDVSELGFQFKAIHPLDYDDFFMDHCHKMVIVCVINKKQCVTYDTLQFAIGTNVDCRDQKPCRCRYNLVITPSVLYPRHIKFSRLIRVNNRIEHVMPLVISHDFLLV